MLQKRSLLNGNEVADQFSSDEQKDEFDPILSVLSRAASPRG
jgi:hypothetical protein